MRAEIRIPLGLRLQPFDVGVCEYGIFFFSTFAKIKKNMGKKCEYASDGRTNVISR
jgi:hypothetical protein